MPKWNPLLKSEIEGAMRATHSNAAAARHLNVGLVRYKKYAQLYGLWELHKNISGKGIRKPILQKKSLIPLQDILEGKHPYYSLSSLKSRILTAGIFKQECALCGYNKSRPNGQSPLLLWFRDNNRTNHKLDNIELRCFNCMYLTNGSMKYPVGRDWMIAPAAQDVHQTLSDADLAEIRKELAHVPTALE